MRACSLLLGLVTSALFAQEDRLWGVTASGGANGQGTVFSVRTDGSDFRTVYDFSTLSGWGPEGGLCLAPNGLLYGFTTFGGAGIVPAGSLFTVDPVTGTFTKLHDFNSSEGGFTWARPIRANDGLLYGVAYGGSDGGGSIYRVDPATNAYTELHALDQSTDGGGPTGALLQAADGLLYGTAAQGGEHGESGTLFRFDPATNSFTKLHDFDGADGGRTPYGGLCQAGNGWLYGTTSEGGAENKGILYTFDPVGLTFQKIHDFAADPGANATSSLLRLAPDLLLGTVANGGLNSGGYLFTLVPSTATYTVVRSFGLPSGNAPVGDLTLASDGHVYGMNSLGGAASFGTLYRLDLADYTPTVLHAFSNAADGGLPRAEVVLVPGNTGVAERDAAWQVAIGPNPCGDRFQLRCAPDALPLQARVCDATARAVAVFTLTRTVTERPFNEAPGLYTLSLTGANGTRVLRLVKER